MERLFDLVRIYSTQEHPRNMRFNQGTGRLRFFQRRQPVLYQSILESQTGLHIFTHSFLCHIAGYRPT